MDVQPKKLITRIVEFCCLFALSAFLLRLGVCYLSRIWWALLIIAVIAIAAVVAYRLWKNKVKY